MNEKLIIIIPLLVFILQSCDPGYEAKIINHSDRPIEVIFEYDGKIMQQNLERKISFIPEVIYNNENSNTSFEIDTINFIVTSLIQSEDTLNLELGIGTHPEFRNIEKIKIFGTDSSYLDNKETMIKAFTEKTKYQYELIIK